MFIDDRISGRAVRCSCNAHFQIVLIRSRALTATTNSFCVQACHPCTGTLSSSLLQQSCCYNFPMRPPRSKIPCPTAFRQHGQLNRSVSHQAKVGKHLFVRLVQQRPTKRRKKAVSFFYVCICAKMSNKVMDLCQIIYKVVVTAGLLSTYAANLLYWAS